MTTEEIEKKAPAKKMSDAERDLLLKAKAELEAVEVDEIEEAINKAITTLQRNADAQKKLINSVNDKNDKLQEQIKVIDLNSIKLVIPSELIRRQLDDIVKDHDTKLMESVNEVNVAVNSLYEEDVQEAIKSVVRINDLKNRICDLEDNEITDLDYEIETAVQNELSNCYYVEESDVERMIDDSLDDYITRNDIDSNSKLVACQLQELQRKVDSLTHNKLMYRVKSLFNKIISKLSLKKLLSPRSNR